MKVQMACLSVVAALAVGPQAAVAADFGNVPPGGVINGGIRDYGGAGGVPVPAPVPIPDYKPSFYFRIDGGYGISGNTSVSESGGQYGWLTPNGQNGYSSTFGNGPDLQAFDPAWLSKDFSDIATYGAGVGTYIGSGWRMDATVEGRSNNEAELNGSATFNSNSWYPDPNSINVPPPVVYGNDANGNGVVDRITHVDFQDKTTIAGSVWMANLYYDFMTTERGFTPYVGAGVGLVWNELKRVHTTTVTSCDNENPCAGTRTDYAKTTEGKADTASLAAALMAGASYQLTDITSLDVGYRFLYLAGTDFDTNIDGYNSNMSISDQYIHQIRAGLRFDVN